MPAGKPARIGMTVAEFLAGPGRMACTDARRWLRARRYRSMANAWDACPHKSWLMFAHDKVYRKLSHERPEYALYCEAVHAPGFVWSRRGVAFRKYFANPFREVKRATRG